MQLRLWLRLLRPGGQQMIEDEIIRYFTSGYFGIDGHDASSKINAGEPRGNRIHQCFFFMSRSSGGLSHG